MDLISREALKELLQHKRNSLQGIGGDEYALKAFDYCIKRINEQPTIEAVPVVHGEWIDDTGCLDSVPQYKCSKCGKKPILSSNWVSLLTDFCPCCGADLRKKV
jgi:rRNA maturation endonuclease Nob1